MTERLKRWWPAILVGAAVAWQFRAPLVGRVYWFEDIQAYFHPLWTAAARNMRGGDLPSWDLGAWSGQPLVADPQIGVLYPPNWLWLWLQPMRLYALLQLAHAGFGAAGMWALARARGRSREAAAVAALGLGVGAFMVLETRHAMFVATTAWLPWVLWSVERFASERRLEHLVALAASSAMAILAGGWSMLLFGSAVAAILAISNVARAGSDRRRTALGLLAALAIAAGLAAAQLLPALVHAGLSPRALGLTYSEAASYAWPSWRYALTLLLPTLYGDDARGSYVGAPDQWELCGYAVGLVSALLVPLSLLPKERRGERVALLLCCALALALARGAGGLVHPLLFRLPLLGQLRCPARALYVWSLAAPLLAADGFDALVELLPRQTWARLLAGALPLALAVELLVTFRAENPSTPLAATHARPEAAGFLAEHGRPGRMATDVHLGQRFHNAGLLWNFESAVGYSSLPIWRYLHLLWIANHGSVYPHAQIAGDLTAQGLWRFSSPIVDLLGVRWLVAPRDRPPSGKGFERVFTGSDGVDVWQNSDAYPRAFLVYRAQVVGSESEAARAVAATTFWPNRFAVVEQPIPGVPEPPKDGSAPFATEIHALSRLGSTDLAVEVRAHAPGVLVVAEPWYPGWRVTVDDRPAPLLRVDYALRGVALEPGTHVIAMTFEDDPLFYGEAISFTAIALLAGLLVLSRRRAQAS